MLFAKLQSAPIAFVFLAMFAAKAQEFYAEKSFEPINLNEDTSVVSHHDIKFKVDTAILTINAFNSTQELSVYFLSDYCYKCGYYSIANITEKHGHNSTQFLIDSRWKSNLRINGSKCSIDVRYQFEERAYYVMNISTDGDGKCVNSTKIVRVSSPYRTNLPILIAAVILFGLSIIYYIFGVYMPQRRRDQFGSVERFINTENASSSSAIHTDSSRPKMDLRNTDLGTVDDAHEDIEPTPPLRPIRERMVSVDTFRGLCIVIMIFVNYKGGCYWFFHHSAWHGLTVADLVFPWFMFIMGINIVFSFDSLIRKATPALDITYKIIRRTLILFFLGLCIINHSTDFKNMRIPGVLQRFAVAYCIVSFMQWACHKSKADMTAATIRATSDQGVQPWWYGIRDIKVYWLQWLIIAAFEIAWHCLTFLLPVEGCPTGYLGPGGLDENGSHFDCIGGAAGYIDRKVFGKQHMYVHPTAKAVYYPPDYKDVAVPFDPEGLLGSFHSILIVFLGLQAGKIFLYYDSPKHRISRCLVWSTFLGVISVGLTKGHQYGGLIPVNKNIWSTSFVTTLSCFAFFILAVMYFVIDIKKWWTGVPFYYVGMNSIFLYVGHEVFEGYVPFAWGAGYTSTHGELLAMNMLGTAWWVLIAYYCYRIKFFVKI